MIRPERAGATASVVLCLIAGGVLSRADLPKRLVLALICGRLRRRPGLGRLVRARRGFFRISGHWVLPGFTRIRQTRRASGNGPGAEGSDHRRGRAAQTLGTFSLGFGGVPAFAFIAVAQFAKLCGIDHGESVFNRNTVLIRGAD